MKIFNLSVALFVAVAATLCTSVRAQSPAGATVQLVSTFDYPGTGNQTFPGAINDHGDIIGGFLDSSQVMRAFIMFASGQFTPPIADPNDMLNFTFGSGINDSRFGCGFYADGNGNIHGFFLMGRTITNYDVAGSTGTTLYAVNNENDFCGAATIDGVAQGFISLGGTVTEFAVTGATSTTALSLNDADESCGLYFDSSNIQHGFYRDADGTIHAPVDPPLSRSTSLDGNNNGKVFVGSFRDSAGTHGLVFLPPSRFIAYSYPGSRYTTFGGINNHNEIVGRYADSAHFFHGLVARLVPGNN